MKGEKSLVVVVTEEEKRKGGERGKEFSLV